MLNHQFKMSLFFGLVLLLGIAGCRVGNLMKAQPVALTATLDLLPTQQTVDDENSQLTSLLSTFTPSVTPINKPTLEPLFQLPDVDQVVFSIPNTEPWSGREGDPRPDWKGWGAETFCVAPDDTFWIADTAVSPNRLLQYNPQGELLQEISLEGLVVYVYDLAVTQDNIWVLDISAQQPRVVQLNLTGDFLSSVDIPKEIMSQDGMLIGNGAFSLMIREDSELLLNTINGYYELVNGVEAPTFHSVDHLSFYGHTYQVGIYDTKIERLPVIRDGSEFETSPEFKVETDPFLGFNPDGSFVLAGFVLDADFQLDRQVRYYDARGNLLGIARQYRQTFFKDWNHHLAFGSEGAVYQLLSNPDHSVQIVRLGFQAQLPTLTPVLPIVSTPTAPIHPIEHPKTEQDQARNTLIHFFAELSEGNYAMAANHFGDKVDDYLRDPLPGESLLGISVCLPMVPAGCGDHSSRTDLRERISLLCCFHAI